MKYENIKTATFLKRPNRFIAHIEVDGREEICHVKNTGRCRELLTDRAKIYVQQSDNPNRKTKYDLITVLKGKTLINMDSQAPNKVFHEWLIEGNFFEEITLIKPECKYKNSRFDFYIEAKNRKIFAEIKGVTLEENGVVMFPDAPTERGVKHINELIECKREGYEAYIFFIVQMESCKYFTPNRKTHPNFADALIKARDFGVNIIALNCTVTPDILKIKDNVPVDY
ncbi:MAG: DNA/RNA nuclease SfsA [Ruminococcaceae bacterium]|nr:DNA/RNA nuclease SfsA [Oscillospiraceae bacterium]